MTVDNNNKYRYSPLKAFDNDDESVFAFTYNKYDGIKEGYATYEDLDGVEHTSKIKTLHPLKNNEELIEEQYGIKIKHIYEDNQLIRTEFYENDNMYS